MARVSLTKDQSIIREHEMLTTGSLEPTEKPERRPLSTVTENILLKASMTTTNKRGDRGSPYLSPLELLKKPDGEPLTKIEKRTEEIQYDIQETHFSPKPHLFNMNNKNFQLM
jgi:hypothetical protein